MFTCMCCLRGELPIVKVGQRWKGASARAANLGRDRKGSFWWEDNWDTFMRDLEDEEGTVRYIRNNPVKAGVVEDWKEWPWNYVAGEV